MRSMRVGWIIPLLVGILSYFSFGSVASAGQVWEHAKDAFPKPHVISPPVAQNFPAVQMPVLFRSGYGDFQNSAAAGLIIGFLDTDDPVLSVSAT